MASALSYQGEPEGPDQPGEVVETDVPDRAGCQSCEEFPSLHLVTVITLQRQESSSAQSRVSVATMANSCCGGGEVVRHRCWRRNVRAKSEGRGQDRARGASDQLPVSSLQLSGRVTAARFENRQSERHPERILER